MSRNVITAQQFEQARLAFALAWNEEADRTGDTVPGARTTAGLTAALRSLGIAVQETEERHDQH